MAERYRVVVMRSNGWKLPFNIALGIHILILLGALYLPGLFKAKPKFADVYSVSLVNIAEPDAAPAAKVKDPGPPKVAAKPPPPPAAPPKMKKEAPVEEPPKVVEKVEKKEPVKEEPVVQTPAPPKAVSLKPLKQKKINVVKEPEKPPKPEFDRRELQKLAEALKEEAYAQKEQEILAEKAKLAREAFDQERKLLANSIKAGEARSSSSTATERQTGSSTAAPGNSSSSLLESQYNAAILSHLMRFWSVPEYMQKDLVSVVDISIKQDGDLATYEFESKSGDRAYDQFVNKTIEAAKPFPPIPPALKRQTYEVGLRFKPGSIQ